MSLKMCHLLPFYADVDFKKNIRKRPQIETVEVLNILSCAQPISLAWVDPRCRKCKTFKYILKGLRKQTFLKLISLSIILCLLIHNSRSKTASNLHKHHFSEMWAIIVFYFDSGVHLFGQFSIFLS